MKTIYAEIDKSLINDLPRVIFEGRIIVVQTKDEAEKAIDFLLSKPILGFDTETRPSFKKGLTHNVGLLQVSTHSTCFLFRLNMIGMTDSIARLLSDTEVLKIGLSLKDDFHALQRLMAFDTGSFVDLQTFVKNFGIKDMSLQKLYANIFGERISKSQRLSNWDADVLSESQKRYAATDAWACIKIYEELVRIRNNHDYKLVTSIETTE